MQPTMSVSMYQDTNKNAKFVSRMEQRRENLRQCKRRIELRIRMQNLSVVWNRGEKIYVHVVEALQ